MTEDELLRLACIYAERDQEAFFLAYEHCIDAEGRRMQSQTKAFLKKLRAYRLKRWGRTALEAAMDECVPVSIEEIMRRKEPTP